MFHAFEAVTTFHLFALIVIGAGGVYAYRKGSVSVRSVVLHNLICLLWCLSVTLYASEGIGLWAGLFVVSLFLTHALFGKKGGYGQLQRRVPVTCGVFRIRRYYRRTVNFVPVTCGVFRPYVATAFVLSFLQLALYFVPTLRYLWITSLVSPVVGGMLAGVVFSYSDRVVKGEKKG